MLLCARASSVLCRPHSWMSHSCHHSCALPGLPGAQGQQSLVAQGGQGQEQGREMQSVWQPRKMVFAMLTGCSASPAAPPPPPHQVLPAPWSSPFPPEHP